MKNSKTSSIMDLERPHRTTSTPTTSELFICLTSRLSHSSSMRLSSKSILSPGRAGDKSAASLSLSTSLSRRLRHNGSLKGGGGGQSPAMFSTKKNKGCSGFDNPEPSSPKVTCIGQVRVKTKKQGKKMKMRACRSRSKRLSGGEASFRRIEHTHEGLTHQNSQGIQNQPQDCNLSHRNQRWVHLPLTICEALRAFGAEFSCLLPCKSSCFSSCNNGREKREVSNSSGSCGAVCRWLVTLQEGEGENKRRDVELVVGEDARESIERMEMERVCSRRRSIFDDMEFKDEIFDVKKEDNGEEDEAARVSICVPPKNALLLMRCRSDPVKMSALSQKMWEAPVGKDYEDDEEEEEEEEGTVKETYVCEFDERQVEFSEGREKLGDGCKEIDELCEDLGIDEEIVEGYELGSEDLAIFAEGEEGKAEETEEKQSNENKVETQPQEETPLMEEEENQPNEHPPAVSAEEVVENDENEQDLTKNTETEEGGESSESSDLSSSSSTVEESTAESQGSQEDHEVRDEEDQEINKSMVKEEGKEEEEPPLEDQSQQKLTHQTSEPIPEEKPKEETENESKWEKDQANNQPVLPDCLLLMMCEPKLSMEVSKETWVCSTDFIRWLPDRHSHKKPNKSDGLDEPKKKKNGPPLPPQPVQTAVLPARSSISFPTGAGPVANLIEKKPVKAGVGYEPFVLTRCKSAPLRSSAKVALPELACSLWKRESNRKIEPLRRSIGAAGVGF